MIFFSLLKKCLVGSGTLAKRKLKRIKDPLVVMVDVMTLDTAPLGEELEVVRVKAEDAPESWDIWLEEIGFTPGEPCMVLQRAALGGDPIAVRIGVSTFALRLAEAACIEVRARSH
mgnify:CR=1 FL=1